jgi:hypothetical protein
MTKKKKKKQNKYVVAIKVSGYHYRYIKATSAAQARRMVENGNLDTEYDFEECCNDEEVVSVGKVK